MQEIRLSVPGREQSYQIVVGSGLLAQAAERLNLDGYSKVFVVADTAVERVWLPKLQQALPKMDGLVTVKAGESAKTLESVRRIWTAMLEAGCDRQSLVVILGGGVVGDMAGFAASTYERGVAIAHIPTTVVAQADSSVGGKTGVDFGKLKNLIGTFAQPAVVLADTDVLATLPKRELEAGFGEMLKHGLIGDADYFAALGEKAPQVYSTDELAGLIATSVRIKAAVVEADATERGERKILNFGHTVGHAVESLSWDTKHPLLHGEAVAIGLVVEAQLSHANGLISADDADRVKSGIQAAGLPVTIPLLPVEGLLAKMRRDKKDVRGVVEYTLLTQIGKAVYDQVVDEQVVTQVIKQNMETAHE